MGAGAGAEEGIRSSADASVNNSENSNAGPAMGGFPCWRSFNKLEASGITRTYKIKYEKRLTDFMNKPVFLATMFATGMMPRQVVVQFAYTYCVEAHKLLASRGVGAGTHLREHRRS